MMPVVGEITKDYAPDTLTWNETLGQWRTHPGVSTDFRDFLFYRLLVFHRHFQGTRILVVIVGV